MFWKDHVTDVGPTAVRNLDLLEEEGGLFLGLVLDPGQLSS